MSKGIANNLLKAGVKRRRSKEEIKQQKMETERNARDIREKMERYEQLLAENQRMSHNEVEQARVQTILDNLVNCGFMRVAANGVYQSCQTWEQHQIILNERREE